MKSVKSTQDYFWMIIMARKYVFILAFICLSLGFIPVSHAFIQVMDVGSLPFRTINVDGAPNDWAGIPPLVVDPTDDGLDPYEEIVAVYAANDESFLYFLMEFKEVEVTPAFSNYTQNENGYTVCRFFIDIVPGEGSSENRDADFRIVFKTLISFDTQVPVDVAVLEYYEDPSWLPADCIEVQGDSMSRFVEVAVPWDCIGGQNCFNCYFTASAAANTDYAPDADAEYKLIGCCPGESPSVGGRLIPSNNFYEAGRWITLPIITIIIIIGYTTYQKRMQIFIKK
jgi:hypothetical protein